MEDFGDILENHNVISKIQKNKTVLRSYLVLRDPAGRKLVLSMTRVKRGLLTSCDRGQAFNFRWKIKGCSQNKITEEVLCGLKKGLF